MPRKYRGRPALDENRFTALLDLLLGFMQAVQRDGYVKMVRVVVEDLVEQNPNHPREFQMHGAADLRFGAPPLIPVVEPGHGGMRVVAENRRSHHPIPDQEGEGHSPPQSFPSESAGGHCDAESVPPPEEGIGKMDAPGWRHETNAGKQQPLPPDLDAIVQAHPEWSAVCPFHQAPPFW